MGIFNSVKSTGYASRVADIPKTAHFVILQDSSVYACDDDGSNGSNYPILSYKWYIFVEDWEAAIKDLITKGKIGFLPIKVNPATVTTTISTKVELP